MAQYQLLYSGSEGSVLTARPIDCSIPEYLPEPLLLSHHDKTKTIVPSKIDYSRFINEISSRRRPAQLREISNYHKLLQNRYNSLYQIVVVVRFQAKCWRNYLQLALNSV
jgi:hypothetical protein